MDGVVSTALKPVAGAVAALVLAMAAMAAPALAERAVQGEPYVPTIWIDPDGCEHWVMDDGAEGYMDIRKTRDGRPVCHRNVCGVIPADHLFARDGHQLTTKGRATLETFFRGARARGFIITGHTDSRASDAHNMELSERRAAAVAGVAGALGGRVLSVNGYGERSPRATNATAAGMAQNRRVEIICVK